MYHAEILAKEDTSYIVSKCGMSDGYSAVVGCESLLGEESLMDAIISGVGANNIYRIYRGVYVTDSLEKTPNGATCIKIEHTRSSRTIDMDNNSQIILCMMDDFGEIINNHPYHEKLCYLDGMTDDASAVDSFIALDDFAREEIDRYYAL